MKARILIIPSNDNQQINRLKSLFEAAGSEVAVLDQSGIDTLNAEFKNLPVNQKFPNVFKLIGNLQKNGQPNRKQKR